MKIDRMLYLGAANHDKGKMEEYKDLRSTEQSGDGYDRITWDGMAKTGEMVYYNVSERDGNGATFPL